MLDDVRPALAALTSARRARTAVAAADAARWPDGDPHVPMPYVEQGGSLLLVVTEDQRQELLQAGGGYVALDGHALGSVRLSGDFWPVAEPAAKSVLDEIRACHQECLNCPNRRLSQLVGLQVDLVELSTPGEGYRRIDLDAYVGAQPDWVLAVGVQLQEHLNAVHADAVLVAAMALAGLRSGELLAAQVEWIDGYGFEVSLIDESGGRWIRCDYPFSVFDPEQLSAAVHDGLARAAAYGEERPLDD